MILLTLQVAFFERLFNKQMKPKLWHYSSLRWSFSVTTEQTVTLQQIDSGVLLFTPLIVISLTHDRCCFLSSWLENTRIQVFVKLLPICILVKTLRCEGNSKFWATVGDLTKIKTNTYFQIKLLLTKSRQSLWTVAVHRPRNDPKKGPRTSNLRFLCCS